METYRPGVYRSGLTTKDVNLLPFLYSEHQSFPWRKVLSVALPLLSLLILSMFMTFYQRKLRRIELEAYNELTAMKQKMSTLLENMPGMAYQCHNDGKDLVMEYVSDGALQLTGFSQKELVGSKGIIFGSLIHPADAVMVRETIKKATLNKTKYRLEYRIRHINGNYRWVWEQGKLVDSEDSDGLLEGFICDFSDRKKHEEEKDIALRRLQNVIDEIKTLRGIIPICSSCKNIRNDKGAWEQLEAYINKHTEANFSHGICPDCIRKIYPDLMDDITDGEDA